MVIRGLSTVKKSNYFQNCQNCSWFFMSQNLSNKLHSRICSKRVGEHMTEKIEAQHYQLFFAWLFTFGKRQFRWQSYSITCSHALWKSVHPIFVTCELGDEEIRKKNGLKTNNWNSMVSLCALWAFSYWRVSVHNQYVSQMKSPERRWCCSRGVKGSQMISANNWNKAASFFERVQEMIQNVHIVVL